MVASLATVLAIAGPAGAATTPLAQVGAGTGTGAGQLDALRDVTVDPATGNLYVAEGTHRVSVFSPSGQFIYAFGGDVIPGVPTNVSEVCTIGTTCKTGITGGAGGFLNVPTGVDVQGGRLYVVEAGGHRISVFDISGATPVWVHSFGRDVLTDMSQFQVCTSAPACQAGEAAFTAGALSFPWSVELDPASGNLYVADYGNHRISVFNIAGPTFVRAFGRGVVDGTDVFQVCTNPNPCQGGEPEATAGALEFPVGVSLDGSGNLYVTEETNHRVSVFGTAGPTFSHAFGIGVATNTITNFEFCTGTCEDGVNTALGGGLNFPAGIAADSAGNVHVSDTNIDRVSVFKGSFQPSFTQAYGFDVFDGGGVGVFEICPGNDPGDCQAGSGGAMVGQIDSPQGSDLDCRGALWVAEFSNDRVQRFGEPGTPLPPCPTVTLPGDNPATPAAPAKKKKCKRKRKKRSAVAAKKCKRKKK